jgi:hypothetical protein
MSEEVKAAGGRNGERLWSDVTVDRFDSLASHQPGVTTRAAAQWRCLTGYLAYNTYVFRMVPHAFRYACAFLAMLHDVAVVVGIGACWDILALGIDSIFLTALLTVILLGA